MLQLSSALCFLPLIICCALLHSTRKVTSVANELTRHDFPPAFIFGAGTSAYQVEGAAFEDGRTPSTADAYAHSGIFQGDGDVACDQYHRYKEDVQLMVETGLDAYRFSISWPRLLPSGRGHVNPKGLEYYNNLINELVSHGIQPHVTLLHQDVPLILEDEYGGFSNPRVVEDFTAYADVCFREFGDRVLHWTTINEANLFAYATYPQWRAPGRRCYSPNKLNFTMKDAYDPYLIAHHAMLAHASAARLYKEKYQAKQHGLLGFSLYAFYFTPFTNSTEDIMATQRSYTFFIDWLMHPLMYGDYPETIKNNPGVSLPVFSDSEQELVKGTFDYIALNYYAALRVKDNPSSPNSTDVFQDYMEASWLYFEDKIPLRGDPFSNTPWGMQGVLEHFKHVYDNPPILIHENGQLTNYSTNSDYSVDDPSRVEYLSAHIESLLDSVRNGSNVKGYFAWSFLDLFEYIYGFEKTFGLYYVDFNDLNLGRYPKLSQKWYSKFLKREKNAISAGKSSQEDNTPGIFEISLQEGTNMSLMRDFKVHNFLGE